MVGHQKSLGPCQPTIAEIVRDALDDFGNGPDPQVFVQAGQNSADDQLIRNQFTNDDLSNIDGLITHHYTTNSSGNAMNVGGGVQAKLDWVNTHWSVAANDF
jgi:hypothetical protein